MKAQQYIEEWSNSNKSGEVFSEICLSFKKETINLLKKRRIKINSTDHRGLVAVIKQIDEVWRIFARNFPSEINPEFFRMLILNLFPCVWRLHNEIWTGKERPKLNEIPNLILSNPIPC